MAKSTINSTIKGKAYEYACVLAFEELVNKIRNIEIVENSSLLIAKQRWNEITKQEQDNMLKSATEGMRTILKMEPKIQEDGDDKLTISLQSDDKARSGDIRDMLIIRRSIKWEIGISVKHNHAALKHSRLSAKLDFGYSWLGIKCSEIYFDRILPVFEYLDTQKSKGKKWEDLAAKTDLVYLPLLKAFKDEFLSINEKNNLAMRELIKYLLGSNGNDYYKLIHRKNHVTIMPFNIYGSLNTSATGSVPEIVFPKVDLPTKILDFSFKENSKTTLILTMNKGWSVSFRIHNASSRVETSLKFDIQLQSRPENMFYINVEW